MGSFKIIISNNQKEVKIPTGIRMLIRRCCNAILKMEKFKDSAEISVILVDNLEIKKLNKTYRDINEPTDVLSFPMGKKGEYDINKCTGAKILGDIVISMPMAVLHSEIYGKSLQREIAFLTAHSMLHLLGYDHKTDLDKVRMREKEEQVISMLGLPSTTKYVLKED